LKKYGSIHLNLKYWGDNKFPFLVKSKSSLLGERRAVQSLLKHNYAIKGKMDMLASSAFLGALWVGGVLTLSLAILSFSYMIKIFSFWSYKTHIFMSTY